MQLGDAGFSVGLQLFRYILNLNHAIPSVVKWHGGALQLDLRKYARFDRRRITEGLG